MPKHKKTREEKRKADERKSVVDNQPVSHAAPMYVFTQQSPIAHVKIDTHTDTTAVVRHDLVKTAIISMTIFFLQLIFFLLLKNHLLAFSFVRY